MSRASFVGLRAVFQGGSTDFRWTYARRVDKFLLLMRRFVFVAFKLLEREGWDARAIQEYKEMLVGPKGPLQCVPLVFTAL